MTETQPAERAHALLSASGAHRWLNCPPSALLEDKNPQKSSEAAQEGTYAHALGEWKIRKALKIKGGPRKPVSKKYINDEMHTHTDEYASWVVDQYNEAKKADVSTVLNLESRLDFSEWVPDGFGTGDCVIISGKTLHVIDFKYGRGVLVDAWDNPQMKLYALGAISAYGMLFDITHLNMTIYQPRRDNISTYHLSVEELLTWAETVLRPAAQIAAVGGGEYKPGDWCQFCDARMFCRGRARENLKVLDLSDAAPEELSNEELAKIYPLLAPVEKWAADVRARLTAIMVDERRNIEGLKLVQGRGSRSFTDAAAALERLAALDGVNPDDLYEQKAKSLARLESVVGKTLFSETVGDLVQKSTGKLSVASIDEPGKPFNFVSAADDFAAIANPERSS